VSESGPPEDLERRLRNLQAVARHHVSAREQAASEAPRGVEAEPTGWKKRVATLGPVGLILFFGLSKLKLLIPLLKFTKLSTLLTMLLSVWAYALYWGLPFAVGFVLLIFVHESGHALVMQRLGLPAGAPVFIPFVGAFISMRGVPRDAYVEALVGIGGPAFGSLGALACLVVAWVTGSLFWYALASTGFMLNLFNLIPISPLDGGRIVGVISRWLWLAGYAVGIIVFLTTRSPMLFLILLLGLFSLPQAMRGPRQGYFDVPQARRVAIAAAYFGLMAALAVGMWLADHRLEGLRPNPTTVAAALGGSG